MSPMSTNQTNNANIMYESFNDTMNQSNNPPIVPPEEQIQTMRLFGTITMTMMNPMDGYPIIPLKQRQILLNSQHHCQLYHHHL